MQSRGAGVGDASRTSTQQAMRRAKWSLASRLSLVFLAVLALVVLTFGSAAYRVVRESAESRAAERIASVSRELSAGSARSAAVTMAALTDLARDSLIVRALTAEAPAGSAARSSAPDSPSEPLPLRSAGASSAAQQAALTARLLSRKRPADSTLLGWELLTADGTRRYGTSPLGARDSAMLASSAAATLRGDSATRSALYAVDDSMHLWNVVPVRSGGRTVGVLAERRRLLGSVQTEALIGRLTGQDVLMFITSRGSSEWVSVRGRPVPPPVPSSMVEPAVDSSAFRVGDAAAGPVYVSAASVSGTPYRIVLTQSEDTILARPYAFLRQLVFIGLALIAAGTLAAWWLSRREVSPLMSLRRAAESMAQGDYTRVVAAGGAEETAALADAFNTMTMRISGAHATLAEQNEALQRANESKARFLAVMSHELRTPLNAIGGFAELMALGVQGPVTAAQIEGLDRIKRNKEQLLHLVSDILHYTRLEATALTVQHVPVPLQEQFTTMRDNVTEQFARKSVTLQVSDSNAVLMADPVRVQQVLLNLVTNALQFTEAGGIVSVYSEPANDVTLVHVRDSGSGIALEQQEVIFEPFVQADNSLTRRVGGTGLGLAIVRQLVTAMGGEVQVKSAVGKGSTFSVTLPNAADLDQRLEEDVNVTAIPPQLLAANGVSRSITPA